MGSFAGASCAGDTACTAMLAYKADDIRSPRITYGISHADAALSPVNTDEWRRGVAGFVPSSCYTDVWKWATYISRVQSLTSAQDSVKPPKA